MTWSSFVAAHPNATLTAGEFIVESCATSHRVANMDDWVVSVGGTSSTYDFEAAPTLTATTTAPTITAGQPVTVRTTVHADGVPRPNQTVELWAKVYPSTTFHLVTDGTTTASGVASAVQRPAVMTVYQWRVTATGFAPGQSPTRTVQVRTDLTANVFDATLSRTQPLVLWGATTVARPNTAVELFRRTSRGPALVATTHTRSDGTYLFSHALPRGKQRVFTRIGAGAGDLANDSPTVAVTVR